MIDLLSHCAGVVPLRPRIAPWMQDVLSSSVLAALVAEHGSPLNIQSTAPFVANLHALKTVADARGLACRPYFARKANKCLSYVAAARDAGFGIDAASVAEVRQSLTLGVDPARIICTAGVKTDALIALCVEHGVTVIVDNDDELALIAELAESTRTKTPIGLRVAGFDHAGGVLHSRFGYPIAALSAVITRIEGHHPALELKGLQFHLGGYDAAHRASAIAALLPALERLGVRGTNHSFLDIGGGMPMRYLADTRQWETYLDAHAAALEHCREPITYYNDALGRRWLEDDWSAPDAYPTAHGLVQDAWLAQVLDTVYDGQPIHQRLQRLQIELRCEPGRSVLDNCGMTLARVAHRKRDTGGNLLIGLEMNRTQFRTGFAEVLFDPLMIPADGRDASESAEAFLTGTYCTESEFIYKRRFVFPAGVARGDLIVLPNTAGYLMHFLESRSHQFNLAHNLFLDVDSGFRLDGIDRA
jgi:diaminopimelate decarboxylase